MSIVHVATLVTPDGAYGGPIRVAINQLQELANRGHEVELVAGHRGFGGEPPREQSGVPISLFPVKQIIPGAGFAGLASPQLQKYLSKRITKRDVVHVHLARDLITMPAARAALSRARRVVVQPHGMIDASRNPLAPIFDLVMSRRVLRSAGAVLSLTDTETESLREVAKGDIALSRIHNGVPLPDRVSDEVEPLEVLFLARLHPRKRAPVFVEMARRLAPEHPDVRFILVGPDEGDGPEVTRAIANSGFADRIHWEGAVDPDKTLERMARAAVYVLPSVGEVFPMSVLEAMSLGKPVVITRDNGLAHQLAREKGAVLADTVDDLVVSVGNLLRGQDLRAAAGQRARSIAEREYGMTSVAERLERAYV